MTALEIIQRVANAVGFPEPSSAVGSASDDVLQFVELLNQEGRALAKRHNWQAMTYEVSFTTVATESQGSLATLIGATQSLRSIINDTIWNRTSRQPICGPVSSRNWQAQKSLALNGPYPQYRIRGNYLLFDPVPAAGETCYFEYVSNAWATDGGGTTYLRNLASDGDLPLLDEDLLMAGLEWRWLRKKGLSYAEEFASYEQLVKAAEGRDGTKTSLHMDGGRTERVPGVFVPQGSWNL